MVRDGADEGATEAGAAVGGDDDEVAGLVEGLLGDEGVGGRVRRRNKRNDRPNPLGRSADHEVSLLPATRVRLEPMCRGDPTGCGVRVYGSGLAS